MYFFKSVFSDDPEPSGAEEEEEEEEEKSLNDKMTSDVAPRNASEVREDDEQEEVGGGDIGSPSDKPSDKKTDSGSPTVGSGGGGGGGGGWSFGGFIKTFASKSESVIETYRRDLEEFSSGLKRETAVIRQAASRAVKDLPSSLEVGASVAQESLETVGQAIDDIGITVWKGTAEILSQGKEVLLSGDAESDSSDGQLFGSSNVISKRYSRFESQVLAIQSDPNTYLEDPDDLEDFYKWKLGFVLEERDEEIKNLVGDNEAMEGVHGKLVPNTVDPETFWSRYFYRIHKLKQAEDARANLVKRAIANEEDEDLSWDVDDDEEESNVALKKGDSDEKNEVGNKNVGNSSSIEFKKEELVEMSVKESVNDEKSYSDAKSEFSVASGYETIEKSDEKLVAEGKSEPVGSCKDSDFSVVSSQPSLPEEEDLGWDEIEDLSSIDEKKVAVGGSPNKADLRKRLSAADEEEDLSWDIEDDDEPTVKSS